MKRKKLITHVMTAALGASTLTFATPAHAADCPDPTPQLCKDAVYKATACGTQAAAPGGACGYVLDMESKLQTDHSYQPGIAVLPDKYEAPLYPYSKPYSYQKHVQNGGGAQYAGRVQRSQLTTVVNGDSQSVTDPQAQFSINATNQEKAAWEANTNQVNNCREYVYERYYDWSKFKNLIDQDVNNDRLTFELAKSPTQGIWNKTLMSRSGARALPTISFPTNGIIGYGVRGSNVVPLVDSKSPKNGFAAGFKSIGDGQFVASFQGAEQAEVQALLTKIGGLQSVYKMDWDWHDAMSQALTGHEDDELRDLYLKQRNFTELVGARDKLKAEISSQGATPERQAAMTSLNKSILESLRWADTAGCFTAGSQRCDWSPRLFKDHLESFFAREQEKSYHRCIDNTADDFAQAKNAQVMFGAPKADYTTRADDMEDYFNVVRFWGDKQTFPKDPTTGKPVLGSRKADKGRLGSSDIHVDWEYDTGFGVTELGKDTDTCHANLSIDGMFKATAAAYGTSMELIEARAFLGSESSTAKASFYLEVLNEELWKKIDKNVTQDLKVSIAKSGKSSASASFSQTFTIVAIPVTVSAGVGMEVGAEFNASAELLSGRCEKRGDQHDYVLASAKGNIKPWIEADAYAAIGVGIPGFSAGVRADLVIVRGQLPITADAAIRLASNGAITAKLNVGVREELRMLDGKVVLYIDGPLWLDAEEELFSWNGPRIEEDLVKWDKTLPLDVLKNVL